MKDPEATFAEGDVIEIPMPSGDSALARVVHVSTRYKGTIGIVVYMAHVADVAACDLSFSRLGESSLGPLYTNASAAAHYGWKVLRRGGLSESDRSLSARIVGGGVWIGDEYVRPASTEDYTALRDMSVYGMPGVYREIEKAFG